MHKIGHKTCRNKMLICSCGVPPKSCSRVRSDTRVIGSLTLPYVEDDNVYSPSFALTEGSCKRDNESYDSIESKEFLDYLSDC
jgi:hypothetical protein